MIRGLIAGFSALVIILAVILMQKLQAPDVSGIMHLRQPAIRTMPSQKMMVVEAKGAPGKTAEKAFGLLMRTYFGMKGIPKGKGHRIPAPRARWPVSDSVAPSEWIGRYAMPVPDSIVEAGSSDIPAGLSIALRVWTYGEVAEILHIGPYNKEKPAVDSLKKFILNQGYRIIGEHEEEYVRGPGMVFRGNPARYYTVIRYQVEKAVLKDTAKTHSLKPGDEAAR